MTLPVAGVVDQSRPRTLLDLVGNTPLLRLRRFERADGRVQLYAKAEWKNPGGSVKDRAAAAMILDGEARGLLAPGGTVVIADERVRESFAAPNPDERLFYSWSVLFCLPTGMADAPSVGTGAVMRPATLRAYATAAGFRDVEVLPIENDFWRLYRLLG